MPALRPAPPEVRATDTLAQHKPTCRVAKGGIVCTSCWHRACCNNMDCAPACRECGRRGVKVHPISTRVAGACLVIYYAAYAAMGELSILCPVLQLFRFHAMLFTDSMQCLYG